MSQQTIENQTKEGEEARTPVAKKARKRPASHRGLGWTLIHLLGSLKLAMLLFVVIIVAATLGTIEESRFDARVAQHKIYDSTWFTFWLVLLCINLAAVTLTRWPWKKRHIGFIVTHYSIILLLAGSLVGKYFGIEGSIILNAGQEAKRHLFLSEMAIQFGDPGRGPMYRGSFPLDLVPPSEDNLKYYPVPGHLGRGLTAPFARLGTRFFNRPPSEPTLVFDRFSENLVEEVLVVESPGSSASAVRLEMSSAMMGDESVPVDLITEPADASYYDLSGLAQISIGSEIVRTFESMESPTPLMQVRPIDAETVEYHAINSRGEVKEGTLSVGDQVETGWADWTVTLHEVLPEAEREELLIEGSGGAGLTGVRGWLDWGDGRKTERQWFVAGDSHELTLDDESIRFAFGYRREQLPFEVELLDFDVPRDPGTENPAGFTSHLRFTDLQSGETVEDYCGMNTPAVFPTGSHRLVTGFTYKFSQASWNPEDLSESTVQVLRDPGWLMKWVGAVGILIGVYVIFFSNAYRSGRPEDIIDRPNRKGSPSSKKV